MKAGMRGFMHTQSSRVKLTFLQDSQPGNGATKEQPLVRCGLMSQHIPWSWPPENQDHARGLVRKAAAEPLFSGSTAHPMSQVEETTIGRI